MGRKKKQKRARRRARSPRAGASAADAAAADAVVAVAHEEGAEEAKMQPEAGAAPEEEVPSVSALAALLAEGADAVSDEALFLAAMSDVEALSERELRVAKGLAPESSADGLEEAAPGGAWGAADGGASGGVELGPLGVMNYVRGGLPRKVVRRLRRGAMKIADDLDLHGMTWREARREVSQFLRRAVGDGGYTCVLIIHGKGHGAVLGKATLKSQLYSYLRQQPHVVAAVAALPKDGGLGAAYVLLES